MRANARCSRRSWTPPWKKSRSSKRSLSLVCNLHNRQGTAEKERSCPGTRSLSASCVEPLSFCIAYCGSMPRALEQNATMRAHPHARRFRVVAHKVYSFIAFAYGKPFLLLLLPTFSHWFIVNKPSFFPTSSLLSIEASQHSHSESCSHKRTCAWPGPQQQW